MVAICVEEETDNRVDGEAEDGVPSTALNRVEGIVEVEEEEEGDSSAIPGKVIREKGGPGARWRGFYTLSSSEGKVVSTGLRQVGARVRSWTNLSLLLGLPRDLKLAGSEERSTLNQPCRLRWNSLSFLH